MNDEQAPKQASEQTPRAKRFRIGWWTLVGAAAVIGGGLLLSRSQPKVSDSIIDRIRISESATLSHPGGAAASVIEKIKRAAGDPDYYLHSFTEAGEQLTEVKNNTPIGNGLTFSLKTPILLSALREVQVKHEGWVGDDTIVDRVDVTHLVEVGQVFEFAMFAQPQGDDAPRNWQPIAAWSLLVAGGLLVLSTLIRFITQQVI